MTFKGRSTSSEMSRFDRAYTIFYYRSIWPYFVSFPTYSQILVKNREIYLYQRNRRRLVLGKLK